VNRRIEVTEIQREIKRKKGVIEYAEKDGNIKTACRRFGIARSTSYLWRDRCRKSGDELLNGEIFYTLREAQVLIEQWRVHYNTIRPHSALGYRPPAPEIIVPGEGLPMNHEAA
jgi:hypothetical protein